MPLMTEIFNPAKLTSAAIAASLIETLKRAEVISEGWDALNPTARQRWVTAVQRVLDDLQATGVIA